MVLAESTRGFPRIHSIFYAVFDVEKGTIVKHQVPEGSVTPCGSTKPLLDFGAISEYIIPKNQLSKRLVTISTDKHRIMGCPVLLNNHEKYRDLRNEFRFNLSFVFERDAETSSYEAVVRKLARVLEVLEVRMVTWLRRRKKGKGWFRGNTLRMCVGWMRLSIQRCNSGNQNRSERHRAVVWRFKHLLWMPDSN